MTKNQTDDTIINHSDEPTIDDKLTQQYKDIFSAYIENGDDYSLYELSKLARMFMDQNFGPENLLDLHFSAISEFMGEYESKHPDVVKRFMAYALIYHELVKGLSDKVKESREALQKSEEKYRTLVESATDYIYMIDRHQKILSANKSAAILLGKGSEELLGKSIEDIFPKEISSIYIKSLNQLFKTGRSQDEEGKLVAGNKEFWIHTSLNPIRDQNGEVTAAMGVSRDITERKKADNRLKESEERFRSIFENIRDGLLLADIENKKFYMGNNAICEMLGYNSEEIKDIGISDIHPKKDLPYVIEQFERQLRGEITLTKDIPVIRKDGSVFYSDINSSPITLAGKKYLLGIFRDVTERKRAEEALRESEEKLKAMLLSIGDHMSMMDKDLNILWANETAEKIFGNDIIGKKML